MHRAAPLGFHAFGVDDPLCGLDADQASYLRYYLTDLGARSVICEAHYFDRDYLAAHAAFYASSATGYGNACRRLHLFAAQVGRPEFGRAVGGDSTTLETLQSAYLGFCVLRPLPFAPLGRTVVKWYPDRYADRPRVTAPTRNYVCHVAGIELHVKGLAWQEQDGSVASCAAVGLWTLFHASGLHLRHSIPTTARISEIGARHTAIGARVFPTEGLTRAQVHEVIKDVGFEPVLVDADLEDSRTGDWYFSRERFSRACAYLIRSGFPVLVCVYSDDEEHLVCVTGFRGGTAGTDGSTLRHEDENIEFVYVHDDNLGPGVRFELGTFDVDTREGVSHAVQLAAASPRPMGDHAGLPANPTSDSPLLRPYSLIAAVPPELRISLDPLHSVAQTVAATVAFHLAQGGLASDGVTYSIRFFECWHYMGEELGDLLCERPGALSRVRLGLQERVRPLSRFLGVVRIGLGTEVVVDVLFDTTDGPHGIRPFCHVVFSPIFAAMIDGAHDTWDYGVLVAAFDAGVDS